MRRQLWKQTGLLMARDLADDLLSKDVPSRRKPFGLVPDWAYAVALDHVNHTLAVERNDHAYLAPKGLVAASLRELIDRQSHNGVLTPGGLLPFKDWPEPFKFACPDCCELVEAISIAGIRFRPEKSAQRIRRAAESLKSCLGTF